MTDPQDAIVPEPSKEEMREMELVDQELIKHAAVKSVDGMIFLGKCHADCFHQAGNVGVTMSQKADDQGFFTSKGNFVRRRRAAYLAQRSGQVNHEIDILFSEDLWSPTSGGKYKYNSIEGYHE